MATDIPVDSLQALQLINPHFKNFARRQLPLEAEEFFEILYEDIDAAILEVERLRDRLVSDDWQEDDITLQLASFLKGRFYDVEHDSHRSGHCDIVVKCSYNRFEWLAEAKLWKGPKYIFGGWNQLVGRYSTATTNSDHGGLLIYVKQARADQKLLTWKNYFDISIPNDSCEIDPTNQLRMNTCHIHEASGGIYRVKHFAIVLNHQNSTEPEYDEDGNQLDIEGNPIPTED